MRMPLACPAPAAPPGMPPPIPNTTNGSQNRLYFRRERFFLLPDLDLRRPDDLLLLLRRLAGDLSSEEVLPCSSDDEEEEDLARARGALVLLFLDEGLCCSGRRLSRLGRRASRWFRGLRRGLGVRGARGDNGTYALLLSILSLSYRRVVPGGDRTLAAVFSTKSGFFGLSVRYLLKR